MFTQIALLLRGYPTKQPTVLLTQPRNLTDDQGRRLVDIGADSRLGKNLCVSPPSRLSFSPLSFPDTT